MEYQIEYYIPTHNIPMKTLPYELLQYISSYLLPCYQCRLALVSQWCYQWLYNDLLRWHARKNTISAPKCRIINDDVSLIEIGKTLVLFTHCLEHLDICNLTNVTDKFLCHCDNKLYNEIHNINNIVFYHITINGIGIFDGMYKYMDKQVFIDIASIRMSPLLSLPVNILCDITCNIPYNVVNNLYNAHEYLWYLFF